MPHSREVRATSHDRHDPLLVAALAAGDLAGTDRGQALDLTRSCVDCAVLHDDLIVLARATASTPPPLMSRPRDFQLTPADAARLRPGGWRRLVAAFSGARSGVTRPLGVGLATLGLAGLLIGNVQLSLGGSAATPAAAGAGQESSERQTMVSAPAAAPDASNRLGATNFDAAGQPGAAAAASAAPPVRTNVQAGPASSGNDSATGGAIVPPASTKTTTTEQFAPDPEPMSSVATSEPFRPLNLLFGGALVLGLGLLVVSRLRSRSTV